MMTTQNIIKEEPVFVPAVEPAPRPPVTPPLEPWQIIKQADNTELVLMALSELLKQHGGQRTARCLYLEIDERLTAGKRKKK